MVVDTFRSTFTLIICVFVYFGSMWIQFVNLNCLKCLSNLSCVFHGPSRDCLIRQSSDENVNVLYHPPDHEGPILFSYREKVFFGKKRAALRVENGEWSDKFSLDAAGSTGVVECKSEGQKYEVIDHIPSIFFLLNVPDDVLLFIDSGPQHIDAQFVDETNHVYALLCFDEQSAIHDSSTRR